MNHHYNQYNAESELILLAEIQSPAKVTKPEHLASAITSQEEKIRRYEWMQKEPQNIYEDKYKRAALMRMCPHAPEKELRLQKRTQHLQQQCLLPSASSPGRQEQLHTTGCSARSRAPNVSCHPVWHGAAVPSFGGKLRNGLSYRGCLWG